MKVFLRYLNPSLFTTLHRLLWFWVCANVGKGLRVTHRSELFPHSATREQIKIGDYAVIDGTIEVYDRGRLTVGSHVFIGRSRIYCSSEVTIGNNVLISDGVCIMDSDLHPKSAGERKRIATQWALGIFPDVYAGVSNLPVIIGDDCWIGFGCAILKGVVIGKGAIIGAGSVVTENVPDQTVVAGNPAKFVRILRDDER